MNSAGRVASLRGGSLRPCQDSLDDQSLLMMSLSPSLCVCCKVGARCVWTESAVDVQGSNGAVKDIDVGSKDALSEVSVPASHLALSPTH